ncbi:hypothetical protein FAM09_11870 [Niastella caeni]|uniref:Uncharacterized protein n=1 Tax=Niastella caeni TaxID=2569763 RepID=A0A4S8HUX5_9BACT|nr:hypothetical protein [Niastella caeni]THU39205.1 hypothetical protein FAM09_11870 [Niastella caeni]
MKRFKVNLLALALLVGVTSAFAKAGPEDGCNVWTRAELNLQCPVGEPVCCQFLAYTWLYDSNEDFQQGEFYPGEYTPLQ